MQLPGSLYRYKADTRADARGRVLASAEPPPPNLLHFEIDEGRLLKSFSSPCIARIRLTPWSPARNCALFECLEFAFSGQNSS